MEEQKNTTEEVKNVLEGQKSEKPNQPEKKADKKDVEDNKIMAIIGYIFPILFFIPLLSDETKKSPFAKFHANQQLIFLIFCLGGWILSSFLMVILIGFVLMPLVFIASFVFMIMGIINSVNGEMKKLPIIGKFEIIK